MKEVNKDVLKSMAHSLMFDMSEDAYDELVEQFSVLLEQLKVSNELDGLDKAEPMVFPFVVTNEYLREDVPSQPLSKEDVLRNAPETKDGQVVLPRVVK